MLIWLWWYYKDSAGVKNNDENQNDDDYDDANNGNGGDDVHSTGKPLGRWVIALANGVTPPLKIVVLRHI